MSTPRKSYTTTSGLELPLLNLKGKEYLQVMHRIQWFRTENPKGIIKTQLLEKNGEGKDTFAVFRAEIFVDTERGPMMISSGHKMETMGGFADYLEKAESGAIGRALALCGYGTQFCSDELEEGDRLADSPAPVLEKSAVVMTSNGSAKDADVAATTKRSSFRKNSASASEDI